jgi:hypothetical protein
MKPHEAGALDRVTRAARAWGLWLALVLAAAHSISVWHAFTHEPAERTTSRGDKQLAHAEPCGLCIAVASMGGAAAASPTLQLHQFAQQAPGPLPEHEDLTWPQRRPYAIRAPPVAYS